MRCINTLLIVGFITLISCTNVAESDLVEIVTQTEDVTYTNNVKTIIDNNCIECHNSSAGAAAPFPLETYEEVKDKAENGALLVRIQLPDGDANVMPQNDKMPQFKIDVILAWRDAGFLE